MAKIVETFITEIWPECIGRFREDYQHRLQAAAFDENVIGIERAVSAMLELGIDDNRIIAMLQKYWDLRLSDARMFVSIGKNRLYKEQ